jgi:hypothetical protein
MSLAPAMRSSSAAKPATRNQIWRWLYDPKQINGRCHRTMLSKHKDALRSCRFKSEGRFGLYIQDVLKLPIVAASLGHCIRYEQLRP